MQDIGTQLESEQSAQEILKKEKEELSQAYDRAQDSLRETSEDLQERKQENEAYRERFADWDEDTQIYQNLMRCLYKCDSLDQMIQAFGMEWEQDAGDVYSVLKFIGLLGRGDTFLPFLYEFWEKYKQSNSTYLSGEEMEFIYALNKYYRDSFGVEFDFIQVPEMNEKFDKNTMSDMFNRGKLFRTVEGVYVPAIMRDATTYLKMALVRGV